MHGRPRDFVRRIRCGVAACTFFAAALGVRSGEVAPGAAILQDLRSFATTGTVLHVAAHPDDENTALITYFARGRGYRTAYLSLTRGDGGQNEIGSEFDEKLGVARTQELLAARQIDSGRQFFTRAIDFGYSKSVDEALRIWDRAQVLGDVVRVIRQFRPDVIVTRFSPTGGGTHGHHTASGLLGIEAFKLAGDPSAYPEQLAQGLTVWQPKRVMLNGGGPGRGGGGGGRSGAAGAPSIQVEIGGDDPVTGESFGSIASRSRGRHITQGFGNFGGRGGGGSNLQTFVLMGGEPATEDIMEGVDTTWARVPGGAEVGQLAAKAIAGFNGEEPAASVPALLAIRALVAALPSDPLVDDKRGQLDRILQSCLGLSVETTADKAEVSPGETLKLRHAVRVTSTVPVRLVSVRTPILPGELDATRALVQNEAAVLEESRVVPPDTVLTQPYWLREDGAAGIFRVDDPGLIGRPENPPSFPVEYVLEVGAQTMVLAGEAVRVEKGAKGEMRRRVDVVSPVSLHFGANVSLFRPGSTQSVAVDVTAVRAGASGKLKLAVPAGWTVSPASHDFRLAKSGARTGFTFSVTSPAQAAKGRITASVEIDGKRYSNLRTEIRYDHIPRQILQPPARARVVSFDFAIRGRTVGYVPGAGDDTVENLEQLGYQVKTLRGSDLTPGQLQGLDAVVIGVRAFNERRDLAANLSALFAYVERGGTVIAQYNRPTGLRAEQLGPFPISIQGDPPKWRVTDENAPVTFLAPDHPALNIPNRIGPVDFDGWVQERGAYFPSRWDGNRYATILAMSDPGEEPLSSGVLIAQSGKGYYVYTGLAFFRQLPAGVSGAYRLFANLVSLGR